MRAAAPVSVRAAAPSGSPRISEHGSVRPAVPFFDRCCASMQLLFGSLISAAERALCRCTALPLPSAGLNPARTRALGGFGAPLTGQSYAQLLYVDRGSLAADLVISATLENAVTAVFAGNGSVRPRQSRPAPHAEAALHPVQFPGVATDSCPTLRHCTCTSNTLLGQVDAGRTSKLIQSVLPVWPNQGVSSSVLLPVPKPPCSPMSCVPV